MTRSAEDATARAALRRLAPPRPLALLLGIVVVVGLSWALLVAPFQSPDEPAHFAYTQSLAESFRLTGAPGRMGLSSEEVIAGNTSGALRGAGYPFPSPPDWSRADELSFLMLEHGAHPPPRTDGSGFTSASGNPPLYYLLAALPYLIDHGGTLFGRLYTIRVFGVCLLALTALAAWLLAGEVFGRRRLVQLACGATAALLPMATFVSTAVTPDALLITLWTFALWLGARVINQRAQRVDLLALAAVTAAAVLTKATSYALVGPALVAMLLGWLRRPETERRTAAAAVAGAAAVLALPVVAWLALAPSIGGVSLTSVGSSASHPFRISGFLSYVWQFYLPRLPFMNPVRPPSPPLAYTIWVRQLAGEFGWLDVLEPTWVYHVVGIAAGVLVLVIVVLLTRVRGRRHLALSAFFALTLLGLLTLLHITGYRVFISGSGDFLQGRYLLPAIGLLALAVGLVIRRLPAGIRPGACGALVMALLCWQVISLTAVIKAYYL